MVQDRRIMKIKLIFLVVMLSLVTGVASSQGRDEYSTDFVKQYIEIQKTGISVSMEEKNVVRLGDGVWIAVLKLYDERQLSDPNVVRTFLPVIHKAFQDPGLIQIEEDRKPQVTLFLLTALEKNTQDQAVKTDISALIDYVKKQCPTNSTGAR